MNEDPRTEAGRLADCYAEYCCELMSYAGQELSPADRQKIISIRAEIADIEREFAADGKQIFFSPTSGEILIGPARLREA